MTESLTQEQINAINNYSSEIKTLKDFVTGVKRSPGMWCGGVGNRGFLSLIREVYQNSVDQLVKPNSPAQHVWLSYNMNTLVVDVKDDGLGIPFGDLLRCCTVPSTGKNFEKRPGEYPSGKHGSGLKITNALSQYMIARSYRYDGTAIELSTTEGYPDNKKENPYPIKNKNKFQGTEIIFAPNLDVMGDIDLDWMVVYKLAKQILIRSKLGVTVYFEAVDKNGVVHKNTIINKDGIVEDLIEHCKNPICKPITIFKDDGYEKIEAAFTFDMPTDEDSSDNNATISFCNMCPTNGGTHESGTIDGICKWFKKYMNSIYLTSNVQSKSKGKKANQLTVIDSDIKSNLVISINAGMLEAIFIGQAKEFLSNTEMEPFCRNAAIECLDQWAKSNPQDLSKLCKYFKDVAELRSKENKEKAKIATKYIANVITGYPEKYARPLKKKKEFIIVEGDK